MRLGWLSDPVGQFPGGAEFVAQELVAAVPDGVELAYIPPLATVPDDLDGYILHNVTTYTPDVLPVLRGRPVVKMIHDHFVFGDPHLRAYLLRHANLLLASSGLHEEVLRSRYVIASPLTVLPPPVRIERPPPGDRPPENSAIWVGRMEPGKGLAGAIALAQRRGWSLDVYGHGSQQADFPAVPGVRYRGPLEPADVIPTMSRYRHFVFLPLEPEPFGRTVIEAWCAGCALELNQRVGAVEWLDRPDALFGAAGRWWDVVLEALNGRR